MTPKPSPYTYHGPKGPTIRAYLMEPGWSPPPAAPEPLPERCTRPLTFTETRSAHGPTLLRPTAYDPGPYDKPEPTP